MMSVFQMTELEIVIIILSEIIILSKIANKAGRKAGHGALHKT